VAPPWTATNSGRGYGHRNRNGTHQQQRAVLRQGRSRPGMSRPQEHGQAKDEQQRPSPLDNARAPLLQEHTGWQCEQQGRHQQRLNQRQRTCRKS
jgi:hypothetical protein